MENKKYIIREYSPDAADLSFYFDDDGLTEKAANTAITCSLSSVIDGAELTAST